MAKTPTSTTSVSDEEMHTRKVKQTDGYAKAVETYTASNKKFTKDSPFTAKFYSADMNKDTDIVIYTDPDNADDFVVKTDELDAFTADAKKQAREDAEREAEEEARRIMENPTV